jgi:hypothetical protein
MTHSTREVTQRPHSREFSAYPSLSITLLLFDLYFGAMIYYCWHTTSGLISEVCTLDRVLNDETVGDHAFFFIAS